MHMVDVELHYIWLLIHVIWSFHAAEIWQLTSHQLPERGSWECDWWWRSSCLEGCEELKDTDDTYTTDERLNYLDAFLLRRTTQYNTKYLHSQSGLFLQWAGSRAGAQQHLSLWWWAGTAWGGMGSSACLHHVSGLHWCDRTWTSPEYSRLEAKLEKNRGLLRKTFPVELGTAK